MEPKPDFTFTAEQRKEIEEKLQGISSALKAFADAFIDAVETFIERIRQFAISLARFFLKRQLLEWKIPNKVADLVLRNLYWRWTLKLGFSWLYSKLAMQLRV